MLSKEAMESLSQPMLDLYNAFETEMMFNMASLLKDKKELLATDPEAWKLQQLQMLGMLDKENLQTLKKYAGMTSSELNALIVDAGLQGLELTDAEIMKAKQKAKGAHQIVPPKIAESDSIIGILEAYQRQAANTLNITNLTMLNSSKQKYIDEINRASLNVASGMMDHHSALKLAINNWVDVGIPALIDKAGKQWGPEGYVRMTIISSVNNATNEMEDERYKQWGVQYVEISSHSGARPKCAKYQGRIFSIAENAHEYPPLADTSIGEPDGLFGINCRHRKYPFFPGISQQTYKPISPGKNNTIYKRQQKQRAIERSIRKAKQRQIMHEAAGNLKEAKLAELLVKKRQLQMREFIDDTGLTRRRGREQIYRKPGKGDLTSRPIPPKNKYKHIENVPEPKLELMSLPELKAKAKELGHYVPVGTKKEMLIDWIKSGPPKPTAVTNAMTNVVKKQAKKISNQEVLEQAYEEMLMDHTLLPSKHEKLTNSIAPKIWDGNIDWDKLTEYEAKALAKYIDEKNIPAKFKHLKKKPLPKANPLEKAIENAKFDATLPKSSANTYISAIEKALKDGKSFDELTKPQQNFVNKYGYMSESDVLKLKAEKAKAEELASRKAPKKVNGYSKEDLERFKTIREIGEWDLDEDARIIGRMSREDKKIIHKYTTNYYTTMNNYLRSKRPRDPSREVHQEVMHLKQVIQKNAHPLKEDTKFFRVMDDDALQFLFDQETAGMMSEAIRTSSRADMKRLTEQIKDRVIGGALHDEAFLSSAYEYGAFGEKYVEVHMHAPKGFRNGIFVESVGEFGSDEAEYLFNAGIKFDIIDVSVESRKLKIHVVPQSLN